MRANYYTMHCVFVMRLNNVSNINNTKEHRLSWHMFLPQMNATANQKSQRKQRGVKMQQYTIVSCCCPL